MGLKKILPSPDHIRDQKIVKRIRHSFKQNRWWDIIQNSSCSTHAKNVVSRKLQIQEFLHAYTRVKLTWLQVWHPILHIHILVTVHQIQLLMTVHLVTNPNSIHRLHSLSSIKLVFQSPVLRINHGVDNAITTVLLSSYNKQTTQKNKNQHTHTHMRPKTFFKDFHLLIQNLDHANAKRKQMQKRQTHSILPIDLVSFLISESTPCFHLLDGLSHCWTKFGSIMFQPNQLTRWHQQPIRVNWWPVMHHCAGIPAAQNANVT